MIFPMLLLDLIPLIHYLMNHCFLSKHLILGMDILFYISRLNDFGLKFLVMIVVVPAIVKNIILSLVTLYITMVSTLYYKNV